MSWLNQIGDFLVRVLVLIPGWGVKVLVSVIFLSLGIFPFLLPREYIFKEAPGRRFWQDIRIWTLAVALIELAIYLYF